MSEWKQYTKLIRLFLRLHLGLSAARASRRRDRRAYLKFLLIGLAVAVGVASVLFTYGMILYLIMKPALEVGMGELLLGLVFLMCMAMVLVLGAIAMISVVFAARDTEFYAALPLTSRAVFLSKLSVVYLLELLAALFLALPAVTLYAIYTPVTFWYWLGVLVVVPLLPAIPMALSALLSLPLMRIAARFKHRELFLVLGGLALIVLLLLGQAQLNVFFASAALNDGQIGSMLTGSEATLRLVTGAFPPAMWAAGALALDGPQALSSFGFYLLAVVTGVFLLTLFGGRAFYRGALAQLETAPARGRGFSLKAVRGRPVVLSLFIREWRVLLRTGVYALNALAGVVIFPLLLIILPLTTRSAGGMQILLDVLASPQIGPWLTPAAAALMCLPALICPAASTAFSREGRQFWLCRSIPVTMRAQMRAKLLCALSVSLSGAVLTFAVLMLFMPLPVQSLLYALPIALSASLPMTAVAMIPDVIKPKLIWHSENEAVKQNVNSILGMLPALLILGLGCATALLAVNGLSLSTPALTLSLAAFFLLLGYGLYLILKQLTNRYLERREV